MRIMFLDKWEKEVPGKENEKCVNLCFLRKLGKYAIRTVRN